MHLLTFHHYEDTHHLTQLYAGIGLLAKKGLVRCTYERSPAYQILGFGAQLLTLTLNGQRKIAYDMDDSDRVIPEILQWSEVYFKRSYARETHGRLSAKIQPLGLYYMSYAPRMGLGRRLLKNGRSALRGNIADLVKVLALHSRLVSWLFALKGGSSVNWYRRFEGSPNPSREPKIIFLTQVWNTKNITDRQILEERLDINKMRCECIAMLRREFPQQFFGGIYPSDYARTVHGNYVIPDRRVFHKKAYLALMHNSDIGIATMGLFGSNGGKLGEYVAASKAIVSERLRYQVPGDFSSGLNYLSFATPEECVAQVRRLVDDFDLRLAMMQRNHQYYSSYLRPDVLVWNSLQKAMEVQ